MLRTRSACRLLAPLALAALLLASTDAHSDAVVDTSTKKSGKYRRWMHPAAGESRSGDPELVFTFDDGPDERYTPEVLDLLKQHHIQAIFFWVGHRVMTHARVRERRRELVRRAVREGHIVATHTIDHLHLCQLSTAQAAYQIDGARKVYAELTGLPTGPLFRTPYGDRCRKLLELLAERGLTHVHWDIDPMEWTDHDSKRVAGYLKHKIANLRGRAVVLIHDTHYASAKALPIVLDFLDAENQRRVARGKPPIRVVSGSELVAERLDPGIESWVDSTLDQARSRLGSALASLVP